MAFQFPMRELTSQYFPLESVMADLPSALIDGTLGDDRPERCVEAIESWLDESISINRSPRSVTVEFARQLQISRGKASIADLAKKLDLSRRHLARIVQQDLGLTPKLFARILRFDAAIKLSRAESTLPLASIACQCGYADQAHMTREFSELARIRPGDMRGAESSQIW